MQPEDNKEKTPKVKSIDATWISFSEDQKDSLDSHTIYATLRRGDREKGTQDPKGGYEKGVVIDLKIRKDNGVLEDNRKILITDTKTKNFGTLTDEEIEQLKLDCDSREGCETKMNGHYTETNLKDDDIVTIVKFEYLDNIQNAKDLLEKKIIQIAKMPSKNPQELGDGPLTMPLIGHDYSAMTAEMWNKLYDHYHIEKRNVMAVTNPRNIEYVLDILRNDPQYQGGGVGVGLKEKSLNYMDHLDSKVKTIRSINFIEKNNEGKLEGHNTDGEGYAIGLEKLLAEKGKSIADKKIIMLGAGGTANAVAFALAERGARIVIINRTVEKAIRLADDVNNFCKLDDEHKIRAGGEGTVAEEIKDADIIVNVSEKGSNGELEQYSAIAPAELPATPENIQKNREQAQEIISKMPEKCIVTDVILAGHKTPLIEDAEKLGLETMDGKPMVVYQAAKIFALVEKKPEEEVVNLMEEWFLKK